MGGLVTTLAFPVPSRMRLVVKPPIQVCEGIQANGQRLSVVFVPADSPTSKNPYTILYSHGNAEDLSRILPYLSRLASVCGANVYAYDWLGYGDSEGEVSEQNCYASIDAVYDFVRKQVDPNRIIAFGRSLGSGPTVDLVSRHPEIRAMVLQSPLESAIRCVMGNVSMAVGFLDIFKNHQKISAIECPVLVMHGDADTVVPFKSGQAIHQACKNAVEPLWVPRRGHNDMPSELIYQTVKKFITELGQ